MKKNKRIGLAIAGFALLLAIVYSDPLLVHRNFGGRDLTSYNLPAEKAIHDAYARGHFPVWMPYVSGGRPLLPNPNAGALYPLRILLSSIPFPLAMRIFPFLHWLLAGIGMMLLIRAVGGSVGAAWTGAVTYVFSGVVVSEAYYPHIEPGMALLPWIVWGARRAATLRAGSLILLSILFGLSMLAGDVFTGGLAILCALLWIVLEEPVGERWPRMAMVGISVLLGSLIAAPQILATLLWIPETNRAVLGMKLGEALHFSISPWRLLEFVVPYPFGPTWDLNDTGIWSWDVLRDKYVGIFITLYAGGFASIAAMSRWRERPVGARFARVLLLLTLAISVLPSLLPDSMSPLSSPLPLRNPEKLAVAATFSLALLAGLYLDRIRSREKAPRWPIAVGGLLALFAISARLAPAAVGRIAVAVTGAGASLAARAGRDLPKSLSEAGLYWMASVVALELLGREQSRAARAAGLLLLTLVPIAANRRIARTFGEDELFAPSPFVRLLNRKDPDGRYRVLGESMYRPSGRIEFNLATQDLGFIEYARHNWYQHAHALFGRGTVFNGDFDAGDLARVEALRKISGTAVRFKDSQNFFASFGLRWGIRYRDQAPVTGYQLIGGDSVRAWDELPGAQPDIRLVVKWREEADSLHSLRDLPSLAADEITIEAGAPARGSARPGKVRVLEDRPEHLLLETRTLDPTWLFVLRGFWNWRTVKVDGREVEVSPAQLAFSAIPIAPGVHRVDWRERFPGLNVSLYGPLLFLSVAGILIWRERRTRYGEGL